MSAALFAECSKCGRGAEACAYCKNIGMSEDWQATCDCGLDDFGHHLTDCLERTHRAYVICSDYGQADLPRADA